MRKRWQIIHGSATKLVKVPFSVDSVTCNFHRVCLQRSSHATHFLDYLWVFSTCCGLSAERVRSSFLLCSYDMQQDYL